MYKYFQCMFEVWTGLNFKDVSNKEDYSYPSSLNLSHINGQISKLCIPYNWTKRKSLGSVSGIKLDKFRDKIYLR